MLPNKRRPSEVSAQSKIGSRLAIARQQHPVIARVPSKARTNNHSPNEDECMTKVTKPSTGNPGALPVEENNYETQKLESEVPTTFREIDADDKEQRLQERAYFIWLNEGSPEGRADIHWEQARQFEVEEEAARGQTRRY
jgi:Protein of unknown function (DUF2934)